MEVYYDNKSQQRNNLINLNSFIKNIKRKICICVMPFLVIFVSSK